MADHQQLPEDENAPAIGAPDDASPGAETPGDGELKLTVRKLELPVRPRGVLAE
jgi:hypothetical protein